MITIKPFDFLGNQGVVTGNTDLDADATAEYATGTTYAEGDEVKVIDTDDTESATYKIYESLQASNTGNDPTIDVGTESPGFGTWWKEIGAPNDLAWMAGAISDKSVKTGGSAIIEFTPAEVVNTIALAGVSSESVTIEMTDPTDGVVYDEDFSMVSYVGIDSFYDWLFESIVRKDRVWADGIPPYSAATIKVTFTVSSGDSEVGLVVAGRQYEVGESQFGTRFSIDNFSRSEFVPRLNRTVFEAADFTEEARALVYIDDVRLNSLRQILVGFRNELTAWNVPEVEGTLTFGRLREMIVTLRTKNGTFVDLDIGGST